MLQFNGEILVMFLRKLELAIHDFEHRSPAEVVSTHEILELDERLKANTGMFKDLSLEWTCAQLEMFIFQTVSPSRDGLLNALCTLRRCFQIDLSKGLLLRLDEHDSGWFEGAEMFGHESTAAFREANYDLGEARSCYAVGRYTACVFHAMIALETGLKALAATVGLTYDRENWNHILERIEQKITGFRTTAKRDLEKAEKIELWSIAAKEFFYFKDGWRNHIMHGRARYDRPGALSILQHVEAFMTHLGRGITD